MVRFGIQKLNKHTKNSMKGKMRQKIKVTIKSGKRQSTWIIKR